MASDFRGKKISNTFQRLVQVDPDDGVSLRDGTGSLVQQLGVQKYIQLGEYAAGNSPSTPSSGKGILFASASNKLYWKSDLGDVFDLTSGSGGGSGIASVIVDVSPQLGGNLDLNTKTISGSGNISIMGTGSFESGLVSSSVILPISGVLAFENNLTSSRFYTKQTGSEVHLILSASEDFFVHSKDDITLEAVGNVRIENLSGSTGDVEFRSYDNIVGNATDDITWNAGGGSGDRVTLRAGGDIMISGSQSNNNKDIILTTWHGSAGGNAEIQLHASGNIELSSSKDVRIYADDIEFGRSDDPIDDFTIRMKDRFKIENSAGDDFVEIDANNFENLTSTVSQSRPLFVVDEYTGSVRFGIGTSDPSGQLHVSSSFGGNILCTSGSGTSPLVGIGTTTPGKTLEVSGSVMITGSSDLYIGSSTNKIHFVEDIAGELDLYVSASDNDLKLYAGDDISLRAKNSLKFHIGTNDALELSNDVGLFDVDYRGNVSASGDISASVLHIKDSPLKPSFHTSGSVTYFAYSASIGDTSAVSPNHGLYISGSVSSSNFVSASNLHIKNSSRSFGGAVSGAMAGTDATDKTVTELIRILTQQGIISSSFI